MCSLLCVGREQYQLTKGFYLAVMNGGILNIHVCLWSFLFVFFFLLFWEFFWLVFSILFLFGVFCKFSIYFQWIKFFLNF